MRLRDVGPSHGAFDERKLTRLFGFPERETRSTGHAQGLADQLAGEPEIVVAVGCKSPQRLEPHELDRRRQSPLVCSSALVHQPFTLVVVAVLRQRRGGRTGISGAVCYDGVLSTKRMKRSCDQSWG